MGENSDKIILILEPSSDLDGAPNTYIGEAQYLKEGLRSIKKPHLIEEISSLLEKGDDGKFDIDEGKTTLWIIPGDVAALHTLEYPLVIFKGDDVIDIDEWWYSPFKDIIFDDQSCNFHYSCDFKKWTKSANRGSHLDYGRPIKFNLSDEDPEWIYALKTHNFTFNIS